MKEAGCGLRKEILRSCNVKRREMDIERGSRNEMERGTKTSNVLRIVYHSEKERRCHICLGVIEAWITRTWPLPGDVPSIVLVKYVERIVVRKEKVTGSLRADIFSSVTRFSFTHMYSLQIRIFLVACTRLYNPPCPSVGRSVGRLVTLYFFYHFYFFKLFLVILSNFKAF